ncbi:ABC transporter permease [Phreatobacter stygius]|uniref:ABC transporter permease n=1 Tax=Phreatobacter stygius TaxID=1940610 RepID=UPI001FE5ACB1|nr:ABC transporter permease subunit [Phreatobacter stygius]
MDTTTLDAVAATGPRLRRRIWLTGILAAAAWLAAATVTYGYEDIGEWSRTTPLAAALALIGFGLFAAVLATAATGRASARLTRLGPWLVVFPLFVALWEVLAAKTDVLPQPFFPPPQALIEVFTDDYAKLGISILHSLRLHATGYLIGAFTGFVLGISVGWSQHIGYWVHPVLRFIGPLPATAWLPVAFFAFPSSWSASVFLVALATAFPTTILTWSGVAAVPSAYYDVARTLGASRRFLIFKVAIPAAMPHVFVGLFMGLGSSFAVLVVAEMLGVKAGLGWYLQWAQGWAAYGNMYAALLVMTLICSTLITLLFRLRDHLLGWQKGIVKW